MSYAIRKAKALLASKETVERAKSLLIPKDSVDRAKSLLFRKETVEAAEPPTVKKKVAEKDEEGHLVPIDCPRCKESNEYNNVFCKKCGWVLDKASAVKLGEKRKKADEIMSRLTQDPESLKQLARVLAKLGLVDKLMKI